MRNELAMGKLLQGFFRRAEFIRNEVRTIDRFSEHDGKGFSGYLSLRVPSPTTWLIEEIGSSKEGCL